MLIIQFEYALKQFEEAMFVLTLVLFDKSRRYQHSQSNFYRKFLVSIIFNPLSNALIGLFFHRLKWKIFSTIMLQII